MRKAILVTIDAATFSAIFKLFMQFPAMFVSILQRIECAFSAMRAWRMRCQHKGCLGGSQGNFDVFHAQLALIFSSLQRQFEVALEIIAKIVAEIASKLACVNGL